MSDTRVCYHAAPSTDGVVAAIEFYPGAPSPGSRPGEPPQPTTRPNAACPRRRTLAQAMQAQHTRQDEIATCMLCFALPADGSGSEYRKSTEVGILVRTSVHLRRQRNYSSTHKIPMHCFSLPSCLRTAARASKFTGMAAVDNVMFSLTRVEGSQWFQCR
jgi:hypothetical protein